MRPRSLPLEPSKDGYSVLLPKDLFVSNLRNPEQSFSPENEVAIDGQTIKIEWLKCSLSPVYFAEHYLKIYNATLKEWIPFAMWPSQRTVMDEIASHQYIVMLKARQLGMSWLCVGYALWMMIFYPSPNVMIMSKRDDEAIELLVNRLGEMYNRLPSWMQAKVVKNRSAHDFVLSNGSRAKAFPTSGGRSYTGSLVILDEADFLPDLNKVLNAIKPTVDAGGQLLMISTVDKAKPLSPFKEIFREAYYHKANSYHPIFLDWGARPDRNEQWYDRIAKDMLKQTGTNDGLYQEYPANPEQALAPLQLDKRIPFGWIEQCRQDMAPIAVATAPGVPGLKIYKAPEEGHEYIIGADPAEGNPTSDDTAGAVIDCFSWEEVAVFAGKWEPSVFAGYIDQVSIYYNHASAMVERNNHGHAVILKMVENGITLIMLGHSDDRHGWLNNSKGKTLMYDHMADTLRDGSAIIHDPVTVDQLASIEAATLSAPEGMHDDHADAITLAHAGRKYRYMSGEPSNIIPAKDPLVAYDEGGSW